MNFGGGEVVMLAVVADLEIGGAGTDSSDSCRRLEGGIAGADTTFTRRRSPDTGVCI